MKKMFFGLFFIGVAVLCFSQNSTGWGSIGLGYDNQWESSGSPKIKTHMSSLAVTTSSYTFKMEKNIGFFSHTSFLFPRTSTIEASGIKVTVDLPGDGFIMGFNGIFGPGFKLNLDEEILLNFGIGPNTEILLATSENARSLGFLLGIGGDIGIKFNITDIIAISLGSTISYNFASYVAGSNSMVGNISGWAKDYSLINLRPYVYLSLNRFYDSDKKAHLGKPNPDK
jgi:hypothetical protein